jgi:hypothetical protein
MTVRVGEVAVDEGCADEGDGDEGGEEIAHGCSPAEGGITTDATHRRHVLLQESE